MLLTACYPTADASNHFPVVSSVEIKDPISFSDCMMDGLNPMQSWEFNRRTVQRFVRDSGIRIDTAAASGFIQLTQTDISNDGIAQIRVARDGRAALTPRTREISVFESCASRLRRV